MAARERLRIVKRARAASGGVWRTGAVGGGGRGGAGGVDVESSSRHAIRPGVRIHYKKGLSLLL
jgi:hypothetical protein